MKKSLCFLFGCLLSFSAVAGDGTVYTWVDKNGLRHYSDKPGASKEAKEMGVRVNGPASGPRISLKETKETSDNPESMTKGWAQGEKPDEKIAPNREAACTVARKNKQVLSDSSKSAWARGADGKPVELTGTAREESIKRAESDIASYCT